MDDPLGTSETHLDTFAVLRMAMDALSSRAYRWATAAGSFALFLWCVIRPDPWRFGAALAFTILVHVPTWIAERKRR